MSPVAETSAVDFADQFQMNAMSAFLCSAAAIRAIRARDEPGPDGAKGGRIVNVAARPGLEPRLGSGMVAYATAKAAVAAMTQALAQETAERGDLDQRGGAVGARHAGQPRRDARRRLQPHG